MIFPFLKGFIGFQKAPITWVIVILNLMIFVTFTDSLQKDIVLQKISKKNNLFQTGLYYKQYLISKKQDKQIQDPNLQKWLLSDQPGALQILGGLAMRDGVFLNAVEKWDFRGDAIQIGIWKQGIAEFNDFMRERNLNIFGLSAQQMNWPNWLTYQFMHGGWLHLLSNMIILVLFGALLEVMFGSLIVLSVYILGGFAGAWFFLNMSGLSAAPMVGASGAVSALIAFYAISEIRKRVKFVYFISPFQGYYGYIYLPTFLILPICFLTDLSGYLVTPLELGGVAYTAHIGGACFGIVAAIFCKLLKVPQSSFLDLRSEELKILS